MPRRKANAARRRTTPATGTTLLAYHRIRAGLTQSQMAEKTGIPIATYRRLERGEISNPRVAWLSNCAIVLAMRPAFLFHAYEEWIPLPGGPETPPARPKAHHRPGRFPNLPRLDL